MWSAGEWDKWQQARLREMLFRAAGTVPWYREYWERRRAGGDLKSPGELKHWPLLDKQAVHADPKAFLSDDIASGRLQLGQTSGTTGTPLQLWHTRPTARQWYALTEARWRGWYGVSRQDRWGILGGQLVTPVAQKTPPFWVWNAGLKQLYLSSYHLSGDTCANYVQAMLEHRVIYLLGYASSLYSLALFAREQRLAIPRLKVVISNAEPLHERERALISAVFNCPVRDTYGMSEMVAAAAECEHGRLHLWPEAGIVEVIADGGDEPVPYGTVGRLICTGLINQDMPLIRYALGDRGALADPGERCPCGRTLPILQSVDGREDDVIVTPDRRRIGRLDPVFKAGFPIRESQVIQESLTSLRVKVVPDEHYTASCGDQIVEALQQRVGPMKITVERVEHIPRGQNGKFRAILSRIDEPKLSAAAFRPPEPRPARPHFPLSLRLYHALPPFARNWVANTRGYSLRKTRYSPATARLADAALERDRWPVEKWAAWQQDQLLPLLRRAAVQVPYYRQLWDDRTRSGDSATVEALADWPVLKKEALRIQPERFLADDCDRRKMEQVTTSGTTGTPISLWRSRETNRQWYALYEARVRLWNGLSRQNRWGHLGGQPVVPFHQSRPPYWVWNLALKQLYLSSMHISPRSSPAYLSAIKEHGLDYLLGYSSSIALLAQSALESGIKVALNSVITDSEPLLESQRAWIEKGLRCPVRETYGMAEIACAASECSAGKLHLWPEVGIIELLDDHDEPVSPGQTGRIVATGFLNPDMPLIRYDTQDLAQADPDPSPCPCGRTLPRIRKILGRNDDVVITRDGRRLVQIDRILDPCYDIREAQIVQEAIGRFTIKIVPGPRWSNADGKSLSDALGHLVGEADISVELVSHIERTWAGKYRIIVSKVFAGQGGLLTTDL